MKDVLNTVLIAIVVLVAIDLAYEIISGGKGSGSGYPTLDAAEGAIRGFWDGLTGNVATANPQDVGKALAQSGELFSGAALAGSKAAENTLPAAVAIGGN